MEKKHVKLGTWLASGSIVAAEIASLFAFDWYLVDEEHGAVSDGDILQILRALEPVKKEVIVRVAGHDANKISKYLDWGATGIMVPHVSNVEQAKTCVDAMRYPPTGHRGYSSSVRAYGYGTHIPSESSAVKPRCIVQIEDIAGVKNSNAIAAVDGVDILFVGPADLKMALSVQGDGEQISYPQALELIVNAAKTNGKITGILVRDKNDLGSLVDLGFDFIAMDSDVAILRKGFDSLMEYSTSSFLK